MSPDFPTVAEVIEGLYPQEGGFPLDGVISVDPFALADLLKATGPIVVKPWPTPITADNAAAVLLHDEYDKLSGTARTNFLGDVAKTAWQRFTDRHLPDLETLVRDLSPAFAHKDLLLQSTSPATEALIRQIGASGAFSVPTNSDFFAITTQNTGENKIDWYLRRSIDYQVSYVPKTGAITATVTVNLHNLAPTTGQPAYVIGRGGQQLTKTPGENDSYITIYTPWLFVSATLDGKVLQLSSSRELGVWADSAFVSIPPGATTTISVFLTGHLRPGSPYRLTMSRQPMVEPDKMNLTAQLPAGYQFSDPSIWGGSRRLPTSSVGRNSRPYDPAPACQPAWAGPTRTNCLNLKGVLEEAAAGQTATFLGELDRRPVRQGARLRRLVAFARSILLIVCHVLSDPTARFIDLRIPRQAHRHRPSHAQSRPPVAAPGHSVTSDRAD
jgi:hypothetical protein